MSLNALEFLQESHRARASNDQISAPKGEQGARVQVSSSHRARSRLPQVQAASSQGSRLMWDVPYSQGEDFSSLQRDVHSLTKSMGDIVLEGHSEVVNMETVELYEDAIRQQYRSTTMMSLAGMRSIRELSRVKEEIAQHERNAVEQARLREAAESMVTRLENDLRKERKVSIRSIHKIRELQAQLNDGEKLNDLFKGSARYKKLEAELYGVGGEYACALISRRSPEFDTSYVREELLRFIESATQAGDAKSVRSMVVGDQAFDEETVDVDVDVDE